MKILSLKYGSFDDFQPPPPYFWNWNWNSGLGSRHVCWSVEHKNVPWPQNPIGLISTSPATRPPTQNNSENISLDWWSIPFYPQLQFIWPYSSILMTSILLTSILMTSTLMISILMTSIMITSILMSSIVITSIQSLQFLSLQIWWLQFSWLQFLWLQFDDLMLMLFRQH